jgi:hypothetical protein
MAIRASPPAGRHVFCTNQSQIGAVVSFFLDSLNGNGARKTSVQLQMPPPEAHSASPGLVNKLLEFRVHRSLSPMPLLRR